MKLLRAFRRVLGLVCFSLPAFAQTVPFTSSTLPIVVIDTKGQAISDDPKIRATIGTIDNAPGTRNQYSTQTGQHDAYTYSGDIGIEFRGSTSQQYPKKPYGFETWEAAPSDESVNVSLLGMPEESDWILNATYNDRSLTRDVLTYYLANQTGRYATRTKYVELILNNQYQGVYILMEKIKPDKNRVNIKKLEKKDITEPKVTGGYILKIDKSTGEPGAEWNSPYLSTVNGTIPITIDYPSLKNLADEQYTYIKNYVTNFENALFGADFKDPTNGYAAYIDVASFIDYFLLTELSRNVDGYRYSTFFYKDRGGKLVMGPAWDYNFSFGNTGYYNGWTPAGWVYNFQEGSDLPTNVPRWWIQLMSDPAFCRALCQRWKEFRAGAFSNANINTFIDNTTSTLQEAQARNFTRWPVLGQSIWPLPSHYNFATYGEEVSFLKTWTEQRLAWMDATIPLLEGACAVTPTSACQVTKVRIYPRPGYGSRLVGGKIQGATSKNGPWTTLLTLADGISTTTWSEFSLNTNGTPYPVLRYLSSDMGSVSVAELEFYSGTTQLTGNAFGDTGGSWGNTSSTYEKVFDGNTNTYYDANNNTGGYVGLELTGCQTTNCPTTLSLTGAGGATVIPCTGTSLGSLLLTATSNLTEGVSYSWILNGNVISTASTYTATQAGTYSVTVSKDGCSPITQTITLTAATCPPVSCPTTLSLTGAGGTTVIPCTGTSLGLGSLLLTAGSDVTAGVQYFWQLNGNAVAGSSTFAATQAGTYSVTVSKEDCSPVTQSLTLTAATCPPVNTNPGCQLTKVSLYPRSDCEACRGRTVGAKIQVMDQSGTWQTVFTIPTETINAWTDFSVPNTYTHLKAVRFYSKDWGYANLAEIRFYNGTSLLTGTLLEDGGGAWGGTTRVASAVFDNNPSTYYDANNASGAYVGWTLSGDCATTTSPVSCPTTLSLTGAGGTTVIPCTGTSLGLGSLLLTAGSDVTAGVQYFWQLNGNAVAGSSTFAATQAGTYSVTVSKDGCSPITQSLTLTAATCTPPVNAGCQLTSVYIVPRPNCCSGRTVGAQIQVSTVGKDGPWQTVLTVPSEQASGQAFSITNAPANLKAVRYYSPDWGYGNLAEIKFYNGATVLTGTGFGDTGGIWGNTAVKDGWKVVFDNNPSTYYDANNASGAYVGLELTACTPTSTRMAADFSAGAESAPVSLQIRPNPTAGRTTVLVHLTQSGNFLLSLHNALGQKVLELSQNGEAGENRIDLDCRNLSEGLYVLRLEAAQQPVQVQKLFKVKP